MEVMSLCRDSHAFLSVSDKQMWNFLGDDLKSFSIISRIYIIL